MYLSVRLSEKYAIYANRLREILFGPDATADEYRDSMVFERAIELFTNDPVALRQFVPERESLRGQSRYAIRQSTYNKLESLSKALNCSIPAVYRAIIKYSLVDPQLKEKVRNQIRSDGGIEGDLRLLSHQLQECELTLSEILKKISK